MLLLDTFPDLANCSDAFPNKFTELLAFLYFGQFVFEERRLAPTKDGELEYPIPRFDHTGDHQQRPRLFNPFASEYYAGVS